jgi:DNA-binding SARP family transcriptional activator
MLIRLLLDLRRALAGGPLPGRNWSSRWATSIAALAIVASAGHVSAAHPHKAPTSIAATNRPTQVRHPLTAISAGQLRPGECLADVAARVLAEPEQWSVLAAANMGRLLGPDERFVDPSLVRGEWCLALPTTAAAPSEQLSEVTPLGHGPNILEELEWLGLGVLGTAALIRRLRALRLVARASRDQGERLRQRDLEIEALEARLDPFGDAILIDWIEAGNRLLRVATSDLAIAPIVRLVRAGPSGVTFYFESGEAVQSNHFVVGEGGYSWTLSLGTPLERITALTNGVGRYAPWLVPVGDDGEDAWLVAVGPGQSLAVDCDEVTAEEVIRGITTALRTLPWAEELSVELLGVDPPPVTEHCYQMASSSTAALLDLAGDPPSPRNAQAAGSWRREPMIVTRSAHETDPLPDRVTAMAGVIRPGKHGSVRLCLDQAGARLIPVGVSLNVPRPNEAARSLIERLLARAASLPLLSPLPAASDLTEPARGVSGRSRHVVRLELLSAHPSATGLTGELSERDRPRVVELLSYLALHGGAATQLELITALFPRAGADAHRRLDTVLVAARRALGDQQLLITGNGVVTVEATLRSDWVDLLTELTRARSEDAALALGSLSLVLDGSSWRPGLAYRWMLTEGLLDHLCFEVCDAMHQLSQLASAGGDLELAARSIHAGLALEPTSELLVRDLMVLRSELDGMPGLIEVYQALEDALGAIGGVEPSWATRALFDELAGKHA